MATISPQARPSTSDERSSSVSAWDSYRPASSETMAAAAFTDTPRKAASLNQPPTPSSSKSKAFHRSRNSVHEMNNLLNEIQSLRGEYAPSSSAPPAGSRASPDILPPSRSPARRVTSEPASSFVTTEASDGFETAGEDADFRPDVVPVPSRGSSVAWSTRVSAAQSARKKTPRPREKLHSLHSQRASVDITSPNIDVDRSVFAATPPITAKTPSLLTSRKPQWSNRRLSETSASTTIPEPRIPEQDSRRRIEMASPNTSSGAVGMPTSISGSISMPAGTAAGAARSGTAGSATVGSMGSLATIGASGSAATGSTSALGPSGVPGAPGAPSMSGGSTFGVAGPGDVSLSTDRLASRGRLAGPGNTSAAHRTTASINGASGSPEPSRRRSGRRRRNFRKASIENLLETQQACSIDDIGLPPVERHLLEKFVDTLSKLSIELQLDEGKRAEGRRRLNNALRALEGWF